MTRTTNARIAGFTYLFYIAVAFPSMVLLDRATRGEGIAAKLVSVAQHATDVRAATVLTVFSGFSALVLAVTLYAITRDVDSDLAMLGFTFRVAEGVAGGLAIRRPLELLWLATAAGANAPDAAGAHALGAFLLMGQGAGSGANFFAVGSTFFSYLLLRGRLVPVPLAWLGVVASLLLVVVVQPLQLAGFLTDLGWSIWMPMLAFEMALALWLLIKGVAPPAARGARAADGVC
jgi:hypothetical protein